MHVRSRLIPTAVAFLWLCSLAGACGRRDQAAVPHVPKRTEPSLRLVALTDVAGYLEPCGCQSKLLGGIDRAAAKLAQLRSEHVPLLFVAAGDLLFGGAPEGATAQADGTQQETWKAETLIEVLDRMGLAAATPGARDLSSGASELERLEALSHFAWLPPRPGPAEAPEAVAGWLGQVAGLQVGVVGISTFAGPQAELSTERIRALTARAQREVDRLQAAGARVVIALVSSDLRTGRRLTQRLHGVAVAVQGGLDDASAPAPSRSGDATLLRAGRQGQGLVVVDLYLNGQTPFVDVSEWTLAERRKDLQARIADLSQRISAWERDTSVDATSLNRQRAKLEALRTELTQAAPPATTDGNALRASYVALGQDQPKAGDVTSMLAKYAARVNEHNREAFANVTPKPPAEGAPAYVGSAACQACHAAAYSWWTKHAHGRAYTTLEQVHKQYNLSCVGCHVTGYGRPGGSTVVHNAGLTHVGCESCHGPGSLHAKAPHAAEHRLTASPGETVCKQCHTPDHSDLFEFQSYVARLRAKGHGLPLAQATGTVPDTHVKAD